MKLIQEIQNENLSVLIVNGNASHFTKLLVASIKKTQASVQVTETMPDTFDLFDVYIFVNHHDILLHEFADHKDKKFICILFNQDQLAQTLSSFGYANKLSHIKIINLQTYAEYFQKDIDTILWFCFSANEDIFLHLYHADTNKPIHHVRKSTHSKGFSFPREPKSLIMLGVAIILISHLLFIPPLLVGTFMNYQQGKKILQGSIQNVSTTQADGLLALSHSLYEYAAPTLHLFSLARPFEDLFQINTSISHLITTGKEIEKDGATFAELVTLQNKSPIELQEIEITKKDLFTNMKGLRVDLLILQEKLPKHNKEFIQLNEKIHEYSQTISIMLEMEPYLDTFFAKQEERKYLLLFANNMELRPGGGFIGSFAVMKVKQYAITELKVYDVYDADGQLTEHLAPPKPISEYLAQPFWFLRDSAFAPDSVTNFHEAEALLEKEIHETDFDGGILFTTTAVQNILDITDALYIPDFQETITKDNFYLKAQLYAEKDFFPGSTQKKRFLASVMNQILLNLGNVSIPKLVEATQKSLNEKQMVIYSRDRKTQEFLEKNYWSGRTLKPKCNLPQAVNCILDYVFPLDANLGVNKANFFVQRPTKVAVRIKDNGTISNTVSMEYTNNSYQDIFPGGPYKDYVQMLVPPNSSIDEVTIDGVAVEDYDETNFEFKTVGFLFEVPPQSSKMVTITYTLPTKIVSGQGTYQLIFQKQIGSPNDNLEIELALPAHFALIDNNFSPLVKGNKINYNTSISSDKIFLIEFSKQ